MATTTTASWSRVLHLRVARLGSTTLENESAQPRAQLLRVEASFDLSIDNHRNRAGFFGHDDRHRIVFLGESDRSAVTRPELLTEPRIYGERQKARGGSDA